MRVIDVKESKANFRKQFGHDCNGTFSVSIIPTEERIRIATTDSFNSVRVLYVPIELTEYEALGHNRRKINLMSVDRNDVLWDFIWNKDGFWLEIYKDAYRELETRSKQHGTLFTMAEIIFNTKKKRYIIKDYESDLVKIID